MYSLIIAIDRLLEIGDPILIAIGDHTSEYSSLESTNDSVDGSQAIGVFLVLHEMLDPAFAQQVLEGSREFRPVVRVYLIGRVFAF